MRKGHNQYGHQHVQLTREKRRRTELVHRLVALAFLDKPDGKDYINHKDYNPKNNNVENLEWCTQKENVLYSVEHMKHPQKQKTNTGEHHISYRKDKRRYRVCYRENGIKKEKRFKTIEEAKVFRDEVFPESAFAR